MNSEMAYCNSFEIEHCRFGSCSAATRAVVDESATRSVSPNSLRTKITPLETYYFFFPF